MKFPSHEFDNAVADLCHDTIADETLVELHELLRTDAAARDEYLWRVELHGELASGRLDFQSSVELDEMGLVLDTTTDSLTSKRHLQRRSFLLPLATVMLLVMLITVGSLWLWRISQPQADQPEIVARLTDLQDSSWIDPATHLSMGDAIRIGQRIELSAGSAEVRFNTGARLRIVGPAIVETRTQNSVFLTLGEVHLVAETPEAKGFTVVTPTSKVVDISTAFTATVSPDGLSRVKVSEGEVDVVLEGIEQASRLRAGETLYVEPGKRQIMTRIEKGNETAAFQFPTIQPPGHEDYADQQFGRASIRVVRGELNKGRGASGPASVLIDGKGQSHEDAPGETAFFTNNERGAFLMDLGQPISISKINSYSWHQNTTFEPQRHRAVQKFTLYGFAGDTLPDLSLPPTEGGWVRIARVNTDDFFRVEDPLDRPAQQACSITAARGEIGRFRYLLWEVEGVPGFQTKSINNTFYGEFDVFGSP